jgi:hypothetical protein
MSTRYRNLRHAKSKHIPSGVDPATWLRAIQRKAEFVHLAALLRQYGVEGHDCMAEVEFEDHGDDAAFVENNLVGQATALSIVYDAAHTYLLSVCPADKRGWAETLDFLTFMEWVEGSGSEVIARHNKLITEIQREPIGTFYQAIATRRPRRARGNAP